MKGGAIKRTKAPACCYYGGHAKKKDLGIKPCRNRAGAGFVRSGFGVIQALSQLQVEAGIFGTHPQRILVLGLLALSNLVRQKTLRLNFDQKNSQLNSSPLLVVRPEN